MASLEEKVGEAIWQRERYRRRLDRAKNSLLLAQAESKRLGDEAADILDRAQKQADTDYQGLTDVAAEARDEIKAEAARVYEETMITTRPPVIEAEEQKTRLRDALREHRNAVHKDIGIYIGRP